MCQVPPIDGEVKRKENRCTVYHQILDALAAKKIFIRTEAQMFLSGTKAKYVRAGKNGVTVIHLLREQGGFWLEPSSSTSDRERLLNGSSDIGEEICILSHELGHHHSDFKEYEGIRERIDSAPGTVTATERAAIYQEEEWAWNWGKKLLQSFL